MTRKRNHNQEAGLTLVEILASLVILGIIIVSFLSIFAQSSFLNKRTDDIIDDSDFSSILIEHMTLMANKGSSLESAQNYLVNEQGFSKVSNNAYVKDTAEVKYIIDFVLENPSGYDDYKITRILISTSDLTNNDKKTILESLLYWRINND